MPTFNGFIDLAETISAESFTPPNDFSRVNDPAKIHMTELKFKIVVLGPQLF
jgi:hypothetical protein